MCKVSGCNNKLLAKGYCSKHYQQIRLYGKILDRSKFDPNEIIKYDDYAEIVLYDKYNKEVARALIDIDDVDKINQNKWCLTTNGYVITTINNKVIFLHRLIMNPDNNMVVDHINHNKLDNRKTNLRVCTQQQNSMNQTIHYDNTSGTAGVSWNKLKCKWEAYITFNYNTIHLGYFTNKEDAILARKEAEIKYFGNYKSSD